MDRAMGFPGSEGLEPYLRNIRSPLSINLHGLERGALSLTQLLGQLKSSFIGDIFFRQIVRPYNGIPYASLLENFGIVTAITMDCSLAVMETFRRLAPKSMTK